MPDPDVAQRPALLVRQGFVNLLQRVLAFDDPSERRVLAIKVIEVALESEEELAAAASLLPFARYRHRKRAECDMLQLRRDLGRREVRSGLVGMRRGREEVKDGGSAAACVGGVAGLGDEVLDDVVERAEVVLVRLAQLEEVEREDRAEFRLEVDLQRRACQLRDGEVCVGLTHDDVAHRCLEQDRLRGETSEQREWGKGRYNGGRRRTMAAAKAVHSIEAVLERVCAVKRAV